jgi:hypothetical protein
VSSPSFERIDYQLRYNKHIERRLIFDLLHRARRIVGFESHGYLGFGSMWFADFRLAHRVLEVGRMISMERSEHADRAAYNNPYSSITVVGGDSTQTLKGRDNAYWQTPHIAWFDYDSRLTQEVVEDLYLFVDKCAAESVVIVTLNSARGSYRPSLAGADQKRGRKETAVGQVEALLSAAVVPPRFEPGPPNAAGVSPDIGEKFFPEFLAEAVLVALKHRIAAGGREVSGEPLTFVPLFNFCHEDGVEMITVGGAVATTSGSAKWVNDVAEGIPMSEAGDLPLHQRLDLAPLTLKEKMALDTCLPHPEEEFIEKAKGAGLMLHDSELTKYWKYHRQFPVFFESPL